MVRVVISALLLVVLAVLVSFNLTFTSSFSLFGLRFESVPVMAIALVSFSAGVIYSLILYLGRALHERRLRHLQDRHRQLDEKEKALAERAAAQEAPREGGRQGASTEKGGRRSIREWLRSLW